MSSSARQSGQIFLEICCLALAQAQGTVKAVPRSTVLVSAGLMPWGWPEVRSLCARQAEARLPGGLWPVTETLSKAFTGLPLVAISKGHVCPHSPFRQLCFALMSTR